MFFRRPISNVQQFHFALHIRCGISFSKGDGHKMKKSIGRFLISWNVPSPPKMELEQNTAKETLVAKNDMVPMILQWSMKSGWVNK